MARDLDPQKLDVVNVLCAPLSTLYFLGWSAYESLYRIGAKKPMDPAIPVIVVGNLTVGGMGKTPTTLAVCRLLKDIGYQAVISASGYGSPRAEAATIAPDGPLLASEWGDEPTLLRWLAPEFPIIVGRRRTLAAKLCAEHFPNAVMVMDDGYQHKPLRHHISIILDLEEVSNPLVLPAGPYREPRSHRTRADFLLPSYFKLMHHGTRFLNTEGQEIEFPPQDIQVLTAIAKPSRLVRTLDSLGFRTIRARHYPDHDKLTRDDLFSQFERTLPIVVTSKDWVKIRERHDLDGWDFEIAHYQVTVEPYEEFKRALADKVAGVILKK
ncbi:MAG: tetraacyldisaccharide 4'-kinase [Chthonomonas sp.]|nr:tetraacyldisaccharide 4'-kinase [Chthonomonas sp.]